MGKHTNSEQEEFMITFMEKHPQLAKNFYKGDRVEMEKLWQTFAQGLNNIGPPLKDCNGWKKIWSDKKSSIKKKISINKREARATGGGPHNQLHISSREEAIGKICGLYDCVDGIEGCLSYGPQTDSSDVTFSELVTEVCPELEIEVEELDQPRSSQANKRKRQDTTSIQENLKSFMSSEKHTYAEMDRSLKEITTTLKINSEHSKNAESDLKRVYRALDKVVESIRSQTQAIDKQTEEISKQTAEFRRHNGEMEKLLYEKNKIKKQILEIQQKELEAYNKLNQAADSKK